MIQYTGTSSRSNYNDERTATIGCALPLGDAPSEARRWIGGPSYISSPFVFLFFLFPSPLGLLSPYPSPRPIRASSSSSTLSSFASSSSYRLSLRCAHRNKSKHLFGVVTGPRSHGGWISKLFLDPPELSLRPPWGFTRPEVRHQRDTCPAGNDPEGSRTPLSAALEVRLSYRFNCREGLRGRCWREVQLCLKCL